MFKKPEKPDPMADRLRRIAAKPAIEDVTEYKGEPKKEDARPARQPTFKQGTIQLRSGERLDVVVKNVSDTGARIEFFRKITLTDSVLLTEPTLRLRTWAYVMWQTEGAAGLQFVAT